MTINLTPDIQSQIYMDNKDSYLISMVDKLTPKMEYEPKDKEEEKNLIASESRESNPVFRESDYTFNSIVRENSLNSAIGSTENFLNTLSNAGGDVKEAS